MQIYDFRQLENTYTCIVSLSIITGSISLKVISLSTIKCATRKKGVLRVICMIRYGIELHKLDVAWDKSRAGGWDR